MIISKDIFFFLFDGEMTTTKMSVLAGLAGLLMAWLTVFVANSPLLHAGAKALESGELATPNPANCSKEALDKFRDCWDVADKHGYPACSGGNGIKGLVRGVKIDSSSSTCYRSIYVNMDLNAAMALWILMFWVWCTARLWETVLTAAIDSDIRWPVALALATDVPSWYYSWKMCFVYTNEYLHMFQRSQWFFTLTELISVSVAAVHIRRSAPVQLRAVSAGLACALFHVLQLTMDEGASVFSSSRMKTVRFFLLACGDCTFLICFSQIARPVTKTKLNNMLIMTLVVLVALFAVFQIEFADGASGTRFSIG